MKPLLTLLVLILASCGPPPVIPLNTTSPLATPTAKARGATPLEQPPLSPLYLPVVGAP